MNSLPFMHRNLLKMVGKIHGKNILGTLKEIALMKVEFLSNQFISLFAVRLH